LQAIAVQEEMLRMRSKVLALAFASILWTPVLADEAVMKELAPTGKLRVGIAYAPAPTPVFASRDAQGDVHGVQRDIATALAKQLGVPMEIVVKATTGELTEACATGAIDIGFMPVDEERRKRLDFSPAYFVIESTFLVTRDDVKTLADVDRPDVTAVGIDGSTTMRAATRTLKQAKVVAAKSVDEAMAMMKGGTAQAFALTHDVLPKLQKQLPGSRILDGAFQVTGVAISLPKDRPAALAFLSDFVTTAKRDGTIRHAFDDAGLNELSIAP
jgi:polar amino acid transport system substrate-binding protein